MSDAIFLNDILPPTVEVFTLTPIGPPGPEGPPGPPGPQGAVGPAGPAGSIHEAPMDGQTYGRMNATWKTSVPISGGSMTGFLFLSADPVQPLHAVTLQYLTAHNQDAGTY